MKSRATELILVDAIEIGHRHRIVREESVASLVASIQKLGLKTPITIRQDANENLFLVTGAHRLEAFKRLNIEKIESFVVEGDDETSSRMWEIAENLHRAELTALERDEHIAEWVRLADEVSSQSATKPQGGRPESGVRAAARELGIDKDDAHRAVKVASISQNAKEVAREEGLDDNRSALLEIAKANEAIQAEVARCLAEERKRAAEEKRAKIAAKKEARARREAVLAKKQVDLPSKKYGIIYADPEWRFETYSENGKDRSAENHYPTSSTEAIMARGVNDIAAEDCVLFLWATVPMLPDALRVMAAWGFAYKSNFVWVKNQFGTGYWSRNKHELLLVGTKGAPPAPAPGRQLSSIISADVRRHSEKPEEAYELIESYFPNLPKIELNARSRRKGWDAWGLETPADAAE